MIWGSVRISGIARPSIVRSGQKARPNRAACRRTSGSTTARVVPTVTVLRSTTSGSGPKRAAICWMARRTRLRVGRPVAGSSGVPTVMM